jgi:predicted AlkP superfamily pyrophosphatase or phosphodiesterase
MIAIAATIQTGLGIVQQYTQTVTVAVMRFVVAALLSLLACAAQPASRDRYVVIVSIDGFANVALRNSDTSVPTLRRLIREGATAPGGMLPVNPTVTWPNHTAMVTGVDASRHGLLYNGLPVRTPGKAMRVKADEPKTSLVLAPTLYDLAHAAGLKTAEVDWVAIEDAPSIDWSFFEIPKPKSSIVGEMIQAGMVTPEQIERFTKTSINVRDEIWTEAAAHILRKHRPNLLLFHMLTTDSVQHRYGTGALAAQTALALADQHLQHLLDTLKESGMLERTTVFVVSDHGFHNAKKVIRANLLLRREGLIRGDDCDAWVIPEGGTAMVYITNENRRAELGPKLRELFRGVEGVQQVIGPEDFKKHGYPPPGPQSRMADLVLTAADTYAFGNGADGETVIDLPAGANPGNHGYLRSHPDMQAIFVAWGSGIRAGATVPEVRNIDIAPTVARLLGLEMKNIEGRVLTEILK